MIRHGTIQYIVAHWVFKTEWRLFSISEYWVFNIVAHCIQCATNDDYSVSVNTEYSTIVIASIVAHSVYCRTICALIQYILAHSVHPHSVHRGWWGTSSLSWLLQWIVAHSIVAVNRGSFNRPTINWLLQWIVAHSIVAVNRGSFNRPTINWLLQWIVAHSIVPHGCSESWLIQWIVAHSIHHYWVHRGWLLQWIVAHSIVAVNHGSFNGSLLSTSWLIEYIAAPRVHSFNILWRLQYTGWRRLTGSLIFIGYFP